MQLEPWIHLSAYTIHILCFLPIGLYHCYLLYSLIKKDRLLLQSQTIWGKRQSISPTTGIPFIRTLLPVPKKAIEFIKVQEGFRADKYIDSGGVATIGYGETNYPYATITHAIAEELLVSRLELIAKELGAVIAVPLNENQISALLSFIYNVGINAFKDSTLLKCINEDAHIYIIQREWLEWKYIKKVESGALKNRRMLEFNLYNQPITMTN